MVVARESGGREVKEGWEKKRILSVEKEGRGGPENSESKCGGKGRASYRRDREKMRNQKSNYMCLKPCLLVVAPFFPVCYQRVPVGS